jgi:hypothetical protein
MVFALRQAVHPKRFDRHAAPDPQQGGYGRRFGQRRRTLTDGAAAAPAASTTGTVALGHTECDVVRGIGAPDSVNLSNNPRGDRVAVINYSKGQRAGIYTFTAGRLSSVERGPEPVAPPKAAKSKAKKKPAAT